MMLPVILGEDLDTKQLAELNPAAMAKHLHLCGATGAGKSVGIQAVLKPIMMEPQRKAAVFVIDPLGGLSRDLLTWIASPRCPNHVRRRLLYIDAASNDFVLPFNPLQPAVGDLQYYHVARAIDLILRAWSSQDLSQMARLMQWSYATATVLAEAKLPLSLSEFLLHPGSDEHSALLRKMPEGLRHKWLQILKSRGGEATKILESTRNRFDPIVQAPQTKRMFGVSAGRFNCEQLIRDRRIVIVNVASQGALSPMLGSTIGSLLLNELFETAFRMSSTLGRAAVDPTLVVLDEFQKFISPDIEDAIPTVRQAGLQLVLAHQSFSQLVQGDLDLSTMIWQCQNRLMFSNNAEDADIIANELAVHSFDPDAIKLAIYQRKQLIAGHRIEWLKSRGSTNTVADSTVRQQSHGTGQHSGVSHPLGGLGYTVNDGRNNTHGSTSGNTHAVSGSSSESESQQLVPIYDEFRELSSIQYKSFDEHRLQWMQQVRRLKTGQCFAKFVNDDRLKRVLINYQPVADTPRARQRLMELLQANFEQDFFISTTEADRQYEAARERLLQPEVIRIPQKSPESPNVSDAVQTVREEHPFRKAKRRE